MKRQISILSEEIRYCFPDLKDFQKCFRFVNNPFGTKVGDLNSQENLLQEQFIDSNGNARRLFSEKSCSNSWIEIAQTYLDISKLALKIPIPFPKTYEYESAFSLLAIKTNAQNWLDAIHNMRIALFETEPNITKLIAQKQVHPSHCYHKRKNQRVYLR